MKKIIAATAAALIVSTPAFANPAEQSFAINASVADTCTMEGINDINLVVGVETAPGSGALLINSNPLGYAGQFWLSCNETNRMSLVPTLGVLKNVDREFEPGVDDPGFKDTINYNIRAENYFNTGPQPRYNSVSGPGSQTGSRGAVHRLLNMTASIAPVQNQDGRPLAGNYQDTVTVTVTII